MDAPGSGPRPTVAAAVERLLSESGGAGVETERWEALRGGDRSRVWRVGVRGDPGRGSASAIVKTAIGAEGDDAGTDGGEPRWRLANEWASLDLIGRLRPEPPLAPRLYGGDLGAGVLVVEDLGTGVGLHQVLLGD